MDKSRPSRKHRFCIPRGLLAIAATIALWPHISSAITFSHGDIMRIGKRVWQNECNGTVSGLTAWNEGEDYASLGIGHFIWYTMRPRGPLEARFTTALTHIKTR